MRICGVILLRIEWHPTLGLFQIKNPVRTCLSAEPGLLLDLLTLLVNSELS